MSPRDSSTDAHEHHREDQVGRKHRAEDEAPFGQLLDRRLGEQLEEQGRQRDVDDEGVHPAERFDRLAGDPRNQEADEDQAEERYDQTDDVGHCVAMPLPMRLRLTRCPARQAPGLNLHAALRQIAFKGADMIGMKTAKFSDRPGGAPPAVSVSRRDLRRRSGVQQHRGMVPVDPRRGAAAQGSALLPPARREFGNRVHRLCLRAEPARRQRRRAAVTAPADRASSSTSCRTAATRRRAAPSTERRRPRDQTKKRDRCPAFLDAESFAPISWRSSPCPALP